MSERTRWIDIAKGISVFFIVLGHVIKANYDINPLRIFCYSFNAQSFFFLAGITFLGVLPISKEKICQVSLVSQISKWSNRIIYPYFIWGIISIIIWWILGKIGFINEDTRIVPNMLGLSLGDSTTDYFQWNRPLWFLPCIFCTYILLFIFLKVFYCITGQRKRICFVFVVLAMCGVVASLFSTVNLNLINIWHSITALILLPIILLGVVYKNYQKSVEHFLGNRVRKIVVSVVLLIMSCFLGCFFVFTDLRQGEFQGYVRFIVVTVLLSLAIIFISQVIGKNRILEYLGKNSLQILVLHKFPIVFFSRCVHILRIILPKEIL